MYIENLVRFEGRHYITINDQRDPFFYFFDYDSRYARINMEFQHFHPYYEICIMLSPNAEHIIEGVPYALEPLDIVLLKPSLLHMTRYPGGTPSKRIIIQFAIPAELSNTLPGNASKMFNHIFDPFQQEVPIFRFKKDIQKQIFSILNDILDTDQKATKVSSMMIHFKFMEFLLQLYLSMDSNIYTSGMSLSSTEGKIYAVTSYIHSHYTEPMSLDELAQNFYISTYYLSHKFKEVTGFTLTDYIQMTRIRNTQSQLLTTSLPISTIAMQCGFTSFSQFNRVFHKYTNMTPSNFRQKRPLN